MLSNDEKWAKWTDEYSPPFKQSCNKCEWEITVKDSGKELESCPICNSIVYSILSFGGLQVAYNPLKDDFTMQDNQGNKIAIDKGDCPQVIEFMRRHFKFKGLDFYFKE